MNLFQGCFFIIRPAFSLKCGWFIRWRHWFGSFLPYTSIIWVIQRCVWWVIWLRWGRGIRWKIDIILCCMNTFLFLCVFHCVFCLFLIFLYLLSPPHCITMMQYVFQSLLGIFCHAKSSRSLWMLIFVRVGSKSHFTIVFFHIIICCRLAQTKNMIIQNFTLQTLSVSKNFLKE